MSDNIQVPPAKPYFKENRTSGSMGGCNDAETKDI